MPGIRKIVFGCNSLKNSNLELSSKEDYSRNLVIAILGQTTGPAGPTSHLCQQPVPGVSANV